jgi:long-chain fatty acid transport protein
MKDVPMSNERPWQACRAVAPLLGCLAFFSSLPCLAGGVWLTETGGGDMAMAGAGSAALAMDATVLGSNPAGLGRLPTATVTVAVVPASVQLDFEGSGSTPGSAHNRDGTTWLGSAFAVKPGERVSWGLGVYSYAGLGADFGEEWVGRRVIERAQLRTLNIAPAVAWRISDQVQVGATLRAQYAEVEAAGAVNNDAAYYGPPAGMPDGHLAMKGQSWAPGGDLGVAWQPRPDWQLGLAWTSAVDHSLDFDMTAKDLHPVLEGMLQQAGTATLKFELPQQVAAGAAWQVSPDTLLATTVRWQDWSALGDARQSSTLGSLPMFPDGLQDTWGASVGASHRLRPDLRLSAGLGYDSNPSHDGSMPAYFPVSSQWRLGLGGEWQARDDLSMRLALSMIQQDDIEVVQHGHPLPLPGIGPLTGTYKNSRMYLLAFAADYRL